MDTKVAAGGVGPRVPLTPSARMYDVVPWEARHSGAVAEGIILVNFVYVIVLFNKGESVYVIVLFDKSATHSLLILVSYMSR